MDRTSAQTVWSGLTLSFSKPDGANGRFPENQDEITDKVIFARGVSEGLYNAVTELNYNLDHVTSPEFTAWATTLVDRQWRARTERHRGHQSC